MLTVPEVSEKDKRTFAEDGYCVIRGGLSERDMALVVAWTDELAAWPEVSGRHWVYREKSAKEAGRDLIQRIENIAPFHAGFAELSDGLRQATGRLLGEETCLFKEKINFKLPGGGGFKPHQDSQAGWDRYADFFVNALVSIDPATVENGCLMIAAGHHRRGVFRLWEPLDEDDMAGMEFVPVPTAPGDIVFFDCYTPHASEPNLSDDARRIYYATYNRLADGDHMARYYADKHKSYPPDIDRIAGREYIFRV